MYRFEGIRDVARLVMVTALAWIAASNGVVSHFPDVLTGLIVGLVAGLAADVRRRDGVAIVVTVVVCGVLLPPWHARGSVTAANVAVAAVVSGIAAALVSRARRAASATRFPSLPEVVALFCILTVAWTTVGVIISTPPAPGQLSVEQILLEEPRAGQYTGDGHLYLRVQVLMRNGSDFYAAFRRAMRESPAFREEPRGLTYFRTPLLFWMWAALPSSVWLSWVYMGLASLACFGAWDLARTLSGPRAGRGIPSTENPDRGSQRVSTAHTPAVLSALLVTTYFTFVVASGFTMWPSAWAPAVALVALALFARALASQSGPLLWAAGGVAVLAAVAREHMVLLPVSMLLGALLSAPAGVAFRRRLQSAAPLVVSVAITALLYLAHWAAAEVPLIPSGVAEQYGFGGLAHLMSTLVFAADFFQGPEVTLPALTCAGVIGVWISGQRGARYAIGGLALAFVAFFVVSGNSAYNAAGNRIGYWGLMLVPIALPAVSVFLERAAELLARVFQFTEGDRKERSRRGRRRRR